MQGYRPYAERSMRGWAPRQAQGQSILSIPKGISGRTPSPSRALTPKHERYL